MRRLLKVLLLVLASAAHGVANDNNVIESTRAREDMTLTTYPAATFWQGALPVYAEKSPYVRLFYGPGACCVRIPGKRPGSDRIGATPRRYAI